MLWGVDIQSAISSRDSINLLWDIVTTLNEANYLGTRGYDEYLDYNPYGIICDDFEEIQYSINNLIVEFMLPSMMMLTM